MIEPKFKIGDIIENYAGHRGPIFSLHYSDVSKDWIYHVRMEDNVYPNFALVSIKESNVKNV